LKINNNRILIASLLIFAALYGIFQPAAKVLCQDVLVYYNAKQPGGISYISDRPTSKANNLINKGFIYSSENVKKVEFTPISAFMFEYEMKIYSKNAVSHQELIKIQEEYSNYLREKDPKIYRIAFNKTYDYTIVQAQINNAFFKIVAMLLLLICFYFLKKQRSTYSNKQAVDKRLNYILLFFAAALSMVFKFIIPLAAFLLTLGLLFRYCRKYEKESTFLIKLFSAATIIRLLAVGAMYIFNNIRYGSSLSYLQPDEMFYYHTSDKIAAILASFKWPNLSGIAEVKQYGYNLFGGIVKLLNGEHYFALRFINVIASAIFVILIYDFATRFIKSRKIARLSAVLMCIMPTQIMFSVFALRDVFISMLIFLMISSLFRYYNEGENKITTVMLFIICGIVLWFFRNYAVALVVISSLFYMILKLGERKNIKLYYLLPIMAVMFGAALILLSKVYNISFINMIIDYFKREGVVKYLAGLMLSITNLDFLISAGVSIYSNPASLILRFFYPETLFLIITLPLFVIGVRKLLAENTCEMLSILLLIIGFITIYKIVYGGWFLRTQLQVFPYQYIIISIGFMQVVSQSSEKVRNLMNKYIF